MLRNLLRTILWGAVVSLFQASSAASATESSTFTTVFVQFGSNLGSTLPDRITALLKNSGVDVQAYSERVIPKLDESSLVLCFGNSTLSLELIDLSDVAPEGFKIIGSEFKSGSTLVATNGMPIVSPRSFALQTDYVHYGAAVGSYALLERLGYGFLHPLDVISPATVKLDKSKLKIAENPYWSKRTWHIHTQHPLEFTEVLNGFDIPMFLKNSSECPKDTFCEPWETMFSELSGLFEWLIANRQNRVEVLLLGNAKWDMWNDLSSGSQRHSRLMKINDLAHEYGMLIGADIPIANLQQHGWAMISLRDSFEKQTADIQDRVDWAFSANYDFISTESGLSEFTKPSCDLMLDLFNIFTERGDMECPLSLYLSHYKSISYLIMFSFWF
jgi:hypothetical protein